jgi:hypothetical protein
VLAAYLTSSPKSEGPGQIDTNCEHENVKEFLN